jgi:signal transduction histidine kinase
MAEGHARHRVRAKRSLRRRVAFTFAAAVVVTALALALSAYFITKSAQEDDALDKALKQSSFNLLLADSMLPQDPQPADYTSFLKALQIRGDFATLIEAGSEIYVSGPQVERGLVSSELSAKIAEGRLGYQTITMTNEPTIAVGGHVRSAELTLYFFFPQGTRLAELTRLRDILLVGGAILAFLGAIAGYWLALRLVAPIGLASVAAERMSRGDLDIRLQAGNDEFGVLAGSFNRMAENLQAKMDALEAGQARERRFVADVAHELRTPVSALVGEASLLKARLETNPDACPPEVAQLAGLVSNDIARLRQLVDDLLEISRLDAKAAETVPEWVDMANFVRQFVRAHNWLETVRIIESHQPAVATAAEGEEMSRYALRTDKRRVERILVNLVENALRHGTTPVTIEVQRWDEAADTAIGGAETGGPAATGAVIGIAVIDSGPGIPQAHLAHIFDRFYKADPSRSSSPGSGLGLAIARENARLLGGDLVAGNGPSGGARFFLSLPVAR